MSIFDEPTITYKDEEYVMCPSYQMDEQGNTHRLFITEEHPLFLQTAVGDNFGDYFITDVIYSNIEDMAVNQEIIVVKQA